MVVAKGIVIQGSNKSKWQIGSLIGTGAFGEVYDLQQVSANNSNNAVATRQWVIKVCPLPTVASKKQKSIKRAADMLFYEAMIYRNTLQSLQGTILPYLPGFDVKLAGKPEPPVIGEERESNFKYMVLERMKQPFWSIVHELNPTKVAAATKKTITVGPIAARLISIVEAIHEKGYLLVDVKPDNFMFGYGSKKDTASNCAELASRLRLLDLGLVEAYKAVGAKHRPDENIADIVGTPLYASLNVHEGHTHSRRDDLEGVGYIVAELIIRLVAALNSETNEYEKGKAPSYLPWSSGNSDQAVGKSKAENVSSMNSPFFARMGQGAASHIMHEYLTTVRSLPYDGKPNYQALLNMLLPLAVEKSSIKLPRSPLRPCTVATAQPNLTPTKPSATRTSNRRKHAAEDDFEFDEDAPRHKKTIYKMDKSKPKECPAAAAIHYTEPEDMDLVPLQKKTRVKMDKSRQKEAPPAVETYEVEDMDIDVIDNSLVDEVDAAMSNVPPKKGGGAIALLVKTGPRTGEKIILNTNETETITIGSDPPQSAGILASKVQCFPDDTQMAARHLRVKLQVRLGHPRVEVSDLKSAQGTLVNSKRMDAGKSVILFPGDEIQAGTTILVVRRTV